METQWRHGEIDTGDKMLAGNPVIYYHPIHRGRVAIFLVGSCYRNNGSMREKKL